MLAHAVGSGSRCDELVSVSSARRHGRARSVCCKATRCGLILDNSRARRTNAAGAAVPWTIVGYAWQAHELLAHSIRCRSRWSRLKLTRVGFACGRYGEADHVRVVGARCGAVVAEWALATECRLGERRLCKRVEIGEGSHLKHCVRVPVGNKQKLWVVLQEPNPKRIPAKVVVNTSDSEEQNDSTLHCKSCRNG